jgi:hypothetical protein
VIPGAERGGHLGTGPAGPDRHPVAERLGHGHDVGLEVLGLEGEPPPGPPQPRLDLVGDEKDAPLVAELAHPGQVVRRRHDHPTLAENRLEEDRRARRGIERALHRAEVVEGHVGEPLRDRLKRGVLLGLAGRGERGQGPTVE